MAWGQPHHSSSWPACLAREVSPGLVPDAQTVGGLYLRQLPFGAVVLPSCAQAAPAENAWAPCPFHEMVAPGRVFVKLGFYAREQVGRYVYHCHILEHEDGGMMAPIEVIDTEEKSAALPSLRHGIREFFSRWRRKNELGLPVPGAAQ